jgi:CubicO group peptidase (beta-lactamase class C family)
MLKRCVAILSASLLSTLALANSDTPANADAPETLSQDSPRQTPAGTRFVAPAGWSIQSRLTAVVFAGGFGVRELGKLTPIDADTLFMIASNTKALTTLMLARLVDKRKFAWTTPVTQLLPSFKLGDADTTRQVLVKHLICACTGMPRQDLEWLFNSKGASPESVIKQLATMQPTSKFGELFQYSNLMAAAAGFVGGHTLHPNDEFGAAYEATMKGEVFEPLGMHATTFDFGHALRGNHAAPHSLDVDGNTEIASMDINDSIRPARPAGGAWSSVYDMLRYDSVRYGIDCRQYS